MEFKRILGFKFAANLTLGIILFGGIIFTLGFGASLSGKAVRGEGTEGFIEPDELSFIRPTPDECYLCLEQFLDANPLVCGIAMEFAPNVYSELKRSIGNAAECVKSYADSMFDAVLAHTAGAGRVMT